MRANLKCRKAIWGLIAYGEPAFLIRVSSGNLIVSTRLVALENLA
jgi:hypothetical protein